MENANATTGFRFTPGPFSTSGTASSQSGVNYHFAYDLGMPRLSCCFCIFASEDALMIAGKHNPELLTEYVRVETKIDHTFKNGPLASLHQSPPGRRGGTSQNRSRTWTM
jgi:hypothetical protein